MENPYATHELQNFDWHVKSKDGVGNARSVEHAMLATLMDIRAELQRLNVLLHCPNFVGVPATLNTIARQTKKAKRARKVTR